MPAHASAQVEADLLPARSAYVRDAGQAGRQIHPTASHAGFNADIEKIVPALGVCRAPSLPVRSDVKFPTQIKRPGIEQPNDRHHKNDPQHEDDADLPQAPQASAAGFSRDKMRWHFRRFHTRIARNATPPVNWQMMNLASAACHSLSR